MSEAIDLSKDALRALIGDGERLWRLEHDDNPEMKDVIWKLLEEAADTLRALTADKPRSFGTSWPEVEQLSQIALENARNLEMAEAKAQGRPFDDDLYKVEARQTSKPSAAAVKRLLSALSLLKWIKSRSLSQKRSRMKLMLALAAGMSPTRAAGAFPELGYTNKHAVLAARHRGIMAIEEKITARCGKIYLNFADGSIDKRYQALPIAR